MVKLPDMSEEGTEEAKSVASKPLIGIDQHFLDCFWKLAEPKEEVRVEASLALIKHLIKNKTVSVKELDYALGRLTKGLSSSRAHARQGFFTALTALLKTLPLDVLSNSKYAEVVQKNLVPKGDKTEKNDIYAGQILAYGAFIKSRRIQHLQDADMPMVREMLGALIVASKQKNYLHSLSFDFVGELLHAECPESFIETQIWPALEPEVAVTWEKQTPDTLYVLLILTRKCPSLLKPKQLKEILGCKRLTDETCFPSLVGTLAKQLPSSNNAKLHEELMTRLAETTMVAKFWEDALIPLANDNRIKGVIVLSLLKFALLAVQDKNEIPRLLPDVVVRIILSAARKEETSSLELSLSCLDVLKDRLLEEDVSAEVQIQVLDWLTKPPASIAFDRLTGTNTLLELTATLKVEAVRHLAALCRTCIENAEAKTQDRVYSVYHLAKLVSHPSTQSEVDWKAEQLQFFLKCAIQGKAKNASGGWVLPRDLGLALLEGFYKSLDNPCKKLPDLAKLLFQVATFCTGLLEEHPKVLLEGKALKAWKAMLSQVTLLRAAGLKKSQKSEDWVNHIFQVLFLHMGLQLIREPEMASEVLEELQLCYQKASLKPKKAPSARKSKNKAIDEEEPGAEEPHWLEVVTDILLSLLSQSRHLLRSLVLSVWTIILPHLTPAALQQILDVIDPTKQEKPLVNAAEDESESEESEDGDGEEGEESGEGEVMEGEEEEDAEDEEMDVEEDDEETVTDKLRLDIRAALGDAAAMTDNESVDVDDMSESEMQRVDQALEAAFRQYRVARPAPLTAKQRSKQPKDDTTLMHFRLRCLDLLDNLLAQDMPLALVMMLPEPLLACLEFTTKDGRQKPLEEKLRTLVRKLANVRKFASVGDITLSGLEELLEILLQKPYQVPSLMPQLGDDLALCATLVVRGALYVVKDHNGVSQTSQESKKKKKQSSSNTNPPTLLSKILSLYTTAVEKYFAKRDSPLPFALFSRVLQMSWSDAWQLGTALIKPAFNIQVPPFRRIQALQLLTALFRNHTALEAAGPSTLGELVHNILSEASKVLMNTTSESFKPKYFAELFSFLRVVHQTLGSGNITADLDEEKAWEEIKQAILLFRDNGAVKQQPEMKRAMRRLALVLQLNLNTPSGSRGIKRGSENDVAQEQRTKKKKSKPDNDGKVAAALNTNEDNNGPAEVVTKVGEDDQAPEPKDTDDEPAKKKKKKKSSGKDKKEAKALRLASLSEGMEQVRFTGGALQEPTEESEEPQVVEDASVSPKKTLKKIKGKKSSAN